VGFIGEEQRDENVYVMCRASRAGRKGNGTAPHVQQGGDVVTLSCTTTKGSSTTSRVLHRGDSAATFSTGAATSDVATIVVDRIKYHVSKIEYRGHS
jgi:hypothetical protein